ncbi:hypothetical protein ACWGCW_21480, partial [Streptomyces sp. NPDC054933]
ATYPRPPRAPHRGGRMFTASSAARRGGPGGTHAGFRLDSPEPDHDGLLYYRHDRPIIHNSSQLLTFEA